MTSPFSDEQLSAVLDGLAGPETVARVQASPEASARLDQLRRVSELVATPPPAATPERRASSIAAALAAAESAAPEGVSSLAVAREKAVEQKRFTDRFSPQVMAAAAAILLVALITPFLLQSGDDVETTATDAAADTAGDDSLNSSLAEAATDAGDSDSADDGSDDSFDSAEATTTVSPTAGADLADDAEEVADDAMSDDAAAEAEPRMAFANSPVALLALIDIGQVQPDLFLTDPEIQTEVNSECLIDRVDGLFPSYALATIESTSGVQIVVIHFDPDGTNTLFDAEDCSPVG